MLTLLVIVILCTAISVVNSAPTCIWGGILYGCGSKINCQRCCGGSWHDGYVDPNNGCICSACACNAFDPLIASPSDTYISPFYDLTYLQNHLILNPSDFNYTYDGRYTTNKVTKIVQEKPGQFSIVPNYPSNKLKSTDLILWFGSELGLDQLNAVAQVSHLNIDETHQNCCASVSVGFPPHCQVKVCCGNGCCC